MKGRKSNINDAGISLLELIIAVSIFAIAAVVFLQAFVNKKSALYLNASTVAQNLMEEIKSKGFEDVSMAFNYPIDPTTKQIRLGFLSDQTADIENGSMVIKESLNNGGTYQNVRLYRASDKDTSSVTASVISTDNGRTGTFNPRTKGKNQSKYYFQIDGLKNGDETFDALVTFDGSKDSGYKKQSGTSQENQKNDYEVPNISKLDTESNAFLIMPQNWDENAMKAIVQGQTEYANKIYQVFNATDEHKTILDADEVYQYTKRTLYIKVEESGGTVKASAKYTLNAYNYSKKGGKEYESMSICPCNGTGKTTLIQMILNHEEGISISPKAKIGYFAQNGYKYNSNQNVMEFMQEDCDYNISEIRSVLASMGFKQNDIGKSLSVLSGGEIIKLLLAKMLMGRYNILLMDEPSNFLDIPSLEALEILMKEYAGTIVFITHDKRLLENVADVVYEIRDKKINLKH